LRSAKFMVEDLEINSLRVKVDENSSTDSNPRLLEVSFGKDSQLVPVSNFTIDNAEVTNGVLMEVNSTNGGTSYLVSISTDTNRTQHQFTLAEEFKFDDNLSIENFQYDFLSHERVYRNEDLLSRWRFEEEGEQDGKKVVRDVATGRNDGFLEGNALLGSGLFGSGLVLDGNGDYFNVPHFRGLFQDGNFTLSAWIYLDNIGVDNDQQDAAIFTTNGNDLNTMLLWYDVNSVGTANRSYSFNLGPSTVNLNRINAPDSLAVQNSWQHIVSVVSGHQHLIYLNGKEVVRTDFAGTSQVNIEGNTVRLGSWDNSGTLDFSGILDEVRIYNSAFSANDIANIYGNGIGDLGIVPTISIDANNSSSPISGRVDFYQFGQLITVTDFNASDLQITGGTVTSFTPDGNGYSFTLTPTRHPSRIVISIQTDSAFQGSIGSNAVSATISHHSPLIGGEHLALWYAFEETNGSNVEDFSDGQIDGNLIGGTRIPGKLGQSLALTSSDYVIANGESLSLSSSLTLSVWAKILDDAQGTLFRTGQLRLQYHDDNTIRGSIYTGGSWREVKARSMPGSWSQYVITYDGAELLVI
jgi:hypothetical protein